MKRLAILTTAALAAGSVNAAIITGDIAVIAANSHADDYFAWVALVDIPALTTIYFTDNGILSDNLLRTGEGSHSWSHSNDVSAGTVITMADIVSATAWSLGTGSKSGGPNLSMDGDQIIVYTGDLSSPNYIFGVNFANSGWTSGATTANDSKAPGENVHVGNFDNVLYIGTTSGTRQELLAAIENPINWTGSNSTKYTWTSGNFIIPEPSTLGLLALAGVVGWIRRFRSRG